jgi:hypothetical protein
MVVPELVTPEECALLNSAGQRVRPPMEVSDSRTRLALHGTDSQFAAEERQCVDAIVQRALGLVEASCPELATTLFGQAVQLHTLDLFYAAGEPAINIYEVGGQFLPHRDKHSLSVLVPLTSPEGFSGGGTAFWPLEECAGRRVRRGCETPTHLLKPSAGTAMLFCGELMHAALPVTAGTRSVLVASLSAEAFRFGVPAESQRGRSRARATTPRARRPSSEERMRQAAVELVKTLETNAAACA